MHCWGYSCKAKLDNSSPWQGSLKPACSVLNPDSEILSVSFGVLLTGASGAAVIKRKFIFHCKPQFLWFNISADSKYIKYNFLLTLLAREIAILVVK